MKDLALEQTGLRTDAMGTCARKRESATRRGTRNRKKDFFR